MAVTNSLTTTGTGPTTDWLEVGPGEHRLTIRWAGSPGSATLQERPRNSSVDFADVEASVGGSAVTIDKNVSMVVYGPGEFRLNVATHTSAATMTAQQVNVP